MQKLFTIENFSFFWKKLLFTWIAPQFSPLLPFRWTGNKPPSNKSPVTFAYRTLVSLIFDSMDRINSNKLVINITWTTIPIDIINRENFSFSSHRILSTCQRRNVHSQCSIRKDETTRRPFTLDICLLRERVWPITMFSEENSRNRVTGKAEIDRENSDMRKKVNESHVNKWRAILLNASLWKVKQYHFLIK